MKQHTIKSDFTLVGKGLHTGLEITTHFMPAPVGSGIRFCRTDLPDRPTYEALASYVSATNRGTVIENGKWRISTIEHIMSALYASGITNCLIEVDAPEVPILDGSAKPVVEQLLRVGIEEQEAEAKTWVVTEPVSFDNGKGCTMLIEPCDHYEAIVHVDYPSPILSKQSASISDLSTYADEVAHARTFCFLREIEWLLHLGLIKGGDLSNALVIYDKKISQWSMNRMCDKLGQPRIDATELGYLSPLNYDNEPARHKLLDLIGDMALLGVRIQGRITATCPGHGFNTSCAKQIIDRI